MLGLVTTATISEIDRTFNRDDVALLVIITIMWPLAIGAALAVQIAERVLPIVWSAAGAPSRWVIAALERRRGRALCDDTLPSARVVSE